MGVREGERGFLYTLDPHQQAHYVPVLVRCGKMTGRELSRSLEVAALGQEVGDEGMCTLLSKEGAVRSRVCRPRRDGCGVTVPSTACSRELMDARVDTLL